MSETISVLMTDLVGSTALADRLGPAAAEEIRVEHFRTLRSAIERTEGTEVKNLGDGVMVVFRGASQALSCAALMQQLVETRNRTSEPRLEVRIGVSLGEATVEDGDYFGEPVVEAARLCAHAGGGQILANAVLRQLAGSRGDHAFEEVGAVQLRGISDPVQVVELKWQAAPADNVPLPDRLKELPETGYVGRLAEREQLAGLWAEAREGSRRLAIIGGDAGVGKTRLSTHLALHVYEQGATVLYGRCDEDLGVPYQPWVQLLGHLVRGAPRRVLDAHLERSGGTLARIVPALGGRLENVPSPRESDPETERYLLYAAAAGLLEEAARDRPVLVILDDLHWADAPTLSLLRHVSGADGPARLMLVGTYRDSELSKNHPLAELLADLHRERGVERMKLTGLPVEDVEALMEALSGHELDDEGRALAAEITRETAGNPFFTGEMLRHLRESGTLVEAESGRWSLVGDLERLGLPQSVREVIGRRVERLGPAAHPVLSAASVIGREFDLDLLAAVLDLDEGKLVDVLELAVTGSLLKESPESPGRYVFTHALVEHTLYEDLGLTRRALLHRQVAEALESRYADEPGERLGELAGHWAAAVVTTDTAKAVKYARLAAESALNGLAPAEAARWYRQALVLSERGPRRDPREHCDLLIGLGEAQRQTGDPEFRRTLLDAATAARELGDADRLCRAVLANSRGWLSEMQGIIDSERVATLEAALAALEPRDPRRARVLALLASELHYGGEPERCRALVAESLALARETGDRETLAHALVDSFMGIWVPDTLEERAELIHELDVVARELDDPRLSVWASVRRAIVGLESGDRELVESALAVMRMQADSVPEPAMSWLRLLHESGWTSVKGELDAAELMGARAFKIGKASGQPDAVAAFGMFLLQIRYFQGRSGELVEQSVRLAHRPGSHWLYRAAGALTLVESGRETEALELAIAEDFSSAPWDWHWMWAMFIWVHVCSRLELSERERELYELLAPYETRFASSGSAVWGSVAWMRGALACGLGRYDEAETHLRAAAAAEESFGAPLLLARTQVWQARLIVAAGRHEQFPQAKRLLDEAEETAERLGGGLVSGEAAESRGQLAALRG